MMRIIDLIKPFKGSKFFASLSVVLCSLFLTASLANAQDFMNVDDFSLGAQQQQAGDSVELPNLLELKVDQQKSTQEFGAMMQGIIDEIDGAEDIAYEKPVMKSLFFNLMEYALIQEARRGFEARLPGTVTSAPAPTNREVRARRELELGGIIYTGEDNWSIYLNEVRVTPNSLPDEILDIDVQNDFVLLKWFDKGTNTIFPVKLRPNQRFNLDARLFFPG